MKISSIGCGNMASAIIGGIIKNGAAEKADIRAADKSEQARSRAADAFGIRTFEDNVECIRGADLVLLAVDCTFHHGWKVDRGP